MLNHYRRFANEPAQLFSALGLCPGGLILMIHHFANRLNVREGEGWTDSDSRPLQRHRRRMRQSDSGTDAAILERRFGASLVPFIVSNSPAWFGWLRALANLREYDVAQM
ncbi:hypothetical protein [Paraburkholderia rhynchosiae]|uniref:hypothetical protein n=1 Tax=Paraburkholderia rhynchosiae TaxID=487049 RepID=UPI0011AF562F|nr:hypothetical protein [Paraburkholderia rhynchosiae]